MNTTNGTIRKLKCSMVFVRVDLIITTFFLVLGIIIS